MSWNSFTPKNRYGSRDLMSYDEAFSSISWQVLRGNPVGYYRYCNNDEWNRALDHIKEGLGTKLYEYQTHGFTNHHGDLRYSSNRQQYNKRG